MIECQIDAALMRRRDFATIEELSAHEELLFSAHDCRESLKREADRYGNNYPSLHGWSMFSWEKTLSFRVWMQGEYSRKERYQVLGSIVREMMFFGETEAEARRERRRVKKRLKRESKLFDEEAVKANPIELLFRNYGLESSTDDYQSEYAYRQSERAMVLNHNATTDLHRRIADLSRRIERAEKKNFRSEVSLGQW